MKKVYNYKEGSAIFVNNEKVMISNEAAKILNFNTDVFDGSINSRVLSILESVTPSKSEYHVPADIDIIKTAEQCTIEEIKGEFKGFNFNAWFILKDGICIGGKIERNERCIYSGHDERSSSLYIEFKKQIAA